MARIYTKTGDDGTTGLLYGGRVSKSDDLVETCGDIDEAVAALGVARAGCTDTAGDMARILLRLQREMFVVAADLATNPRQRHRLVLGESSVSPEMVDDIEQTIDAMVSERPLASVFVVPGTTSTEAQLDLARGITRRAERHAIKARTAGRLVADDVLRYLNRVSDLLYVIARNSVGDAEEPRSHD
jgi:cob(I)alamin adenosyltransferase